MSEDHHEDQEDVHETNGDETHVSDEEEGEEEEEAGVVPFGPDYEILGCLVRRNQSESAGGDEEDDDGVVFIGADAMKHAYEGALDDAMESVASELTHSGSTDESGIDDAEMDEDDDEDDFNFEPTLIHHGKIQAAPTAKLVTALEFAVVFFTMVVADQLYQVHEGDKESGLEFLMHSAASKAVDLAFWKALASYSLLFIVIPTLVGLILGKTHQCENVFGFAVSRYVRFLVDCSQTAHCVCVCLSESERPCAICFAMRKWCSPLIHCC